MDGIFPRERRALSSVALPHAATTLASKAGRCRTADRGLRYVEAPSHVCLRFAISKPLHGFPPLMRRQSCRSPEFHATLQARASLANRVEDIEQVPCRASQPIEPRHDQHIALIEPLEQLGELRPVAPSAADHRFSCSQRETVVNYSCTHPIRRSSSARAPKIANKPRSRQRRGIASRKVTALGGTDPCAREKK
jgi:hypothetical protein